MRRFLFVCLENAGRSEMVEAFARHYGKGRIVAESAGTMPGREVNPTVVQVMKEKGIDTSRNHPKRMDLKRAREADIVVTMGVAWKNFVRHRYSRMRLIGTWRVRRVSRSRR